TPNMLFSPSAEKFHQDFSPRDLSPYAKLVGEVAAVKKRTNQLTEQPFIVATIKYPAGELPVLFAADVEVTAGNVFDGTVFLSFGAGFWANRHHNYPWIDRSETRDISGASHLCVYRGVRRFGYKKHPR